MARFSPGKALHLEAMKYLRANGIRVYDFLRGDEPYKYAFGAEDRSDGTWIVLGPALRRVLGLLTWGKTRFPGVWPFGSTRPEAAPADFRETDPSQREA